MKKFFSRSHSSQAPGTSQATPPPPPTTTTTTTQLPTLEPVEVLSRRVVRVVGGNPSPFTLQGTNTYLVGRGRQRILIDTGEGNKEFLVNLQKALKEQDCTINEILITHHHPDHVGSLGVLCDRLGVEVRVWYLGAEDMPTKWLPKCAQQMTPDQVFRTQGATIRVIPTPGHTSDHVSFFLEEEKVLFSGDMILGVGTTVFEDLPSYMASLLTLLQMSSQITRIFPGHGPVIDDARSKISEYVTHRMQRESQVLKALDTKLAHGIEYIVHKVYGHVPAGVYSGACINCAHHLRKLVTDKRVVETRDWRRRVLWKIAPPTLSSSPSNPSLPVNNSPASPNLRLSRGSSFKNNSNNNNSTTSTSNSNNNSAKHKSLPVLPLLSNVSFSHESSRRSNSNNQSPPGSPRDTPFVIGSSFGQQQQSPPRIGQIGPKVHQSRARIASSSGSLVEVSKNV